MKTLSKSKISIIIIIAAALCEACGYRFAEQRGFPGETERLFVNVLENQTQETGVENIITEALLNELTLRKTHHLANGMADADVIMSGVVRHVDIRTVSTRRSTVADERRVIVSIDLKLTQSDGRTTWAAREITDFEEYFVDPNPEISAANRQNAIRILSKRMAERVLNRFSDDF
ncbi:MAG: LPS assembly lipoprotein LptE [Desulfobacterales bacterium]|jgi:outer membrane lipopolysaccharide assembly protein LptE/RlpB